MGKARSATIITYLSSSPLMRSTRQCWFGMSCLRLLCLVTVVISVAFSQKMGPFDIIVRTFEFCGPKDGGKDSFQLETRTRKYNRTIFVIDASAYLPEDLDDSYKAVVHLAVFTNNGWKENFFKIELPEVCKTLKAYVWSLFVSVTKTANIPSRCPVKKGNYTLKNFPLSLDLSDKVPVFYYNKYKWTVHLIKMNKNEDLHGCIQMIVDVVPKKKH